jgi:hypothetical protein
MNNVGNTICREQIRLSCVLENEKTFVISHVFGLVLAVF